MNKTGAIHIIMPFARANEIRELAEAKGQEVILWESLSECVHSKETPSRDDIAIAEDKTLERSNGIVALASGVRLIVCFESAQQNQEEHWLRLGCMGVLRADDSRSTVEQCLAAVEQDEIWAPHGALSRIVKEYIRTATDSALTRREAEIIGLVAFGRSNQEIAAVLCISRETVRWHLRRIYKKSGVHAREDAARVLAYSG